MKTRVKGNRNRRACINELEKAGWLVDVVEKTGRFVKVKDLYGLFDLIAIDKNSTALIQVSSNTPHAHKYLSEFKLKFPHIIVRQYTWVDRVGWKIFEYTHEGKHLIIKGDL
jgi:hypothetical protein